MKIVWSPIAIQRVTEAAELIALDKPEAAASWARAIFRAVDRLAALPASGRIVPELNRPDVREIIHGAFRIIYRVSDEQILVLTVRRSSRLLDPSELPTGAG